jgi:dCTP deaminase
MGFWSSEKVREVHDSNPVITPFDPSRLSHGAYELSLSDQVILTGAKNRPLADGDPVRIPPGQFSLMYTFEAVQVPSNAIAFISIKAKKKFTFRLASGLPALY